MNEAVQLSNSSIPQHMQWGIYAPQAIVCKNGKSTKEQIDSVTHWLTEKGVPEGNRKVFIEEESGALVIPMKSALHQLVEEIIAEKIGAVLVLSLVWLFQDNTDIECDAFAKICKKHNCVVVTADGMVFDFSNRMHLQMFRYVANGTLQLFLTESG